MKQDEIEEELRKEIEELSFLEKHSIEDLSFLKLHSISDLSEILNAVGAKRKALDIWHPSSPKYMMDYRIMLRCDIDKPPMFNVEFIRDDTNNDDRAWLLIDMDKLPQIFCDKYFVLKKDGVHSGFNEKDIEYYTFIDESKCVSWTNDGTTFIKAIDNGSIATKDLDLINDIISDIKTYS